MKKLFSILLLASVASVSAQVNRTYFDEIYLGERDPFPRKVKMRASVSSVGAADDYYENRIKRFNRGYGFSYDRIHNFHYDAVAFGRLDRHCVHTSFYFPGHLHTPHCDFHHNHFVPVYVQANPTVYTRGVRGSGILGNNSGVGNGNIRPIGRNVTIGRGNSASNVRSRKSIQNINNRVVSNRVTESIMTGYSRPARVVRNDFQKIVVTPSRSSNNIQTTKPNNRISNSGRTSSVYRQNTRPVTTKVNRSVYNRSNSNRSYSRPARANNTQYNRSSTSSRSYTPTRSSSFGRSSGVSTPTRSSGSSIRGRR